MEPFLRQLKQSGKTAWQRLQALEAIQFRADTFLPQVDNGLAELHKILSDPNQREARQRSARDGQGAKNRVTVLPDTGTPDLRRRIEVPQPLDDQDLAP